MSSGNSGCQIEIPLPSTSNMVESNNERTILTQTLPNIQWITHNKFLASVSEKEINEATRKKHMGNILESYFDFESDIIKPGDKKKKVEENEILKPSQKRYQRSADTKIEFYSLTKLKKNKKFNTWLERMKTKKKIQNFYNLTEHQNYLMGDMSHINDGSKGKNLKEGNLLSQIWGSKNLITKACPSLRFAFEKFPAFHPEGKFKLIWNIIVCLGIMYQLFTMTIELFFQQDWDKVNKHLENINQIMDKLQTFIIVIDMLLNMFTGFIYRGKIIMHPSRILKNYLKSFLLMDSLVILPILYNFYQIEIHSDSMGSLFLSKLSLIKLIYFLRLLKLTRTFSYLEQILSKDEKIEGLLSLLKLCFKILFMAHFFACIWYFVGKFSERNGENSWITKAFSEHPNSDWRTHYLHSLYWSITTMITVGYGDITPISNKEVAFVILSMVIGCGLFGYSLNNIGMIFNKIFSQEVELKSNLRIINRYMHRKRIDFELQGKVRQYLDFALREAEDATCQKEIKLISKLSNSLRRELLLQANGKIVLKNPIFKNTFAPGTIQKLAELLVPIDFAPGEYVYEEKSNESDSIFFISKGKIDISLGIKKSDKQDYLKVKTLREGDAFGEFSFFTGKERETGAVSVGYTKLFTLRRQDFLNVLQKDCDEYEKYCLMRDNLILYNDYSVMKRECYSCGHDDHHFLFCPALKYSPNRSIICLQRKRLRKPGYERRNKRTACTLSITGRLISMKTQLEDNYDFAPFETELNYIRQELKLFQDDEESGSAKLIPLAEASKVVKNENALSAMSNHNKINRRPVPRKNSGQIAVAKKDDSFSSGSESSSSREKITSGTPSFQIHQLKLRSNEKESGSNNNLSILTKKKFNPNIAQISVSRKSLQIPINTRNNIPLKDSPDVGSTTDLRLFDNSFDVGRNFKHYLPKYNMNEVIMRIRLTSAHEEKTDARKKYNVIRMMRNRVSILKKRHKLVKQPSLMKKLTNLIF